MVALNLPKSLIKPTLFIDEETKIWWDPASLPSTAMRTPHLASLGIWDYGDNTGQQLLSADHMQGMF